MNSKMIYVVLTFKFKKEKQKWTACCEELGTATFADTIDEADKNLKEAVLLHLNTLEDLGECERFFKENRIQTYADRPKREDKVQSAIKITTNSYFTNYIHPIHEELLGP